MKIIIRENTPPIEVNGLTHLDQLIIAASKQAKDEEILSIIFLNADNSNQLGIVVGGDETVLGFNYNNQDQLYCASKGKQNCDDPIMTCYLLFQHHTEFPRKYVITLDNGLKAVHEFYEFNTLPNCIEWQKI